MPGTHDAASPPAGFSEAARATLSAVLDCLIPPSADGRLPAAGALGLATYVEQRLGAATTLLESGLEALDSRAAGCGAAGFVALDAEARLDVLRAHVASDPGFLPGIVFHVYAGYYQHPAVQQALGMEGRPPYPLGYPLEPGDPSLLDPVRARPPLYRRV